MITLCTLSLLPFAGGESRGGLPPSGRAGGGDLWRRSDRLYWSHTTNWTDTAMYLSRTLEAAFLDAEAQLLVLLLSLYL